MATLPGPGPGHGSGSGRKKKACVECRQQKMRCEGGSSDGSASCSRCTRLSIDCVFSSPFERVHKRKRIQELESETIALKRELQSIAPTVTAAPTQFAAFRRAIQSRAIDGLEVTSTIIDDCFQRYYQDFHCQLPILDPLVSTDELYGHSSLLFWVVLSIGSRKYNKHPTLIHALSSRVTNHVMVSISARNISLETIRALILFLTWPFPSSSFNRTSSFAIGAMLIHMAMQCGLHTPYIDIESSRLHLYPESVKAECLERATLWAYAVITYQRLCSISGQPALMSLDLYNEHPRFKDILLHFPVTLQLQFQLSNILVGAHKAFLHLNLLTMTAQQEIALEALLKKLNSKIDSMQQKAVSASDFFYIASARQEINAMHFFKSKNTLDVESCRSIFDATTQLFELILGQETPHARNSACPCFLTTACLIGTALILRIFRGPFSTYIDKDRASKLYLEITQFLKSCSLQKGDSADRGAKLAERFWENDKLFQDTSGSVDMSLGVRNRLASSPMLDMVFRWREEPSDSSIIRTTGDIDQQNSVGNFIGQPVSGISGNISATNSFPENEATSTNDLWGDLNLDLNDDWIFSNLLQ